ncbi:MULTISPECIES: SIMPL domain-containing protein [Pseudovibrio]|uniref:SIMPL domain-containing protein n=1 Tax=Stappiaceae TaxID=2821832 RepID=UPI002365042A|nr:MULTISPECIES: SIMPL domain-containing protein [Pseudovibrio]MDD7910259.1 SIMPL domain-containing protein [Pseudovibrio exalbescens]MDX5593975.1 SIMPL domain-containing protein [Pseudovibrio sp. SPO723]
MSFKKLAGLGLVSVLALSVVSTSLPAMAQDSNTHTITVSGSGSVSVVPDRAIVVSRVVTQKASAQEALSENSQQVKALIEQIQAAGIEDKNIQTSGFGINPVYDNSRQSRENGEAPQIVAYRVSNGVEVASDDVSKLGALLTSMVDAGANSVGQISFVVSEPEEKLDEARQMAVKDALRKAKLYAEAAGVELGDILTINESGSGNYPRPEVMYMARAAMDKAAPISAGEEQLSANVVLTIELEQ